MPCLGGGRRLVWDRSDVVARCDGGREGGTGDQFGGREGGSGGAARDEGAGAGRRESGAASGGARGDVGGAIGSSRAPTRSGFFPGAPVRPAGRCLGGGGAVDRRAIAVASARARANSPRDDPSDRLDDADERVRGGSGRPRPSRARAPAPGRRSGGPAPRHDPPPSRKRRKKRAGRLRETVARGRRDASRTSEARVNLACVSARRSRRWAGSCAERDAGSGARDRPRHHPFANLLTRGTSPRARRARAPAGAPKNARTNSLQNWNF